MELPRLYFEKPAKNFKIIHFRQLLLPHRHPFTFFITELYPIVNIGDAKVQQHKDLVALCGQPNVHPPICIRSGEQIGGLPELQGAVGAVSPAHRICPLGGLGRTHCGTHHRGNALLSKTEVIGTLCLFHPNGHVHRLYSDHPQLHRIHPMFLRGRVGRFGLDGAFDIQHWVCSSRTECHPIDKA